MPLPGLGLKCFSNLFSTPFHWSLSSGGVPILFMFGQDSAYFLFISIHSFEDSSESSVIASAGHSGSQTPQSMHSSKSIIKFIQALLSLQLWHSKIVEIF